MSTSKKSFWLWAGALLCAASLVRAAPFAKTVQFQQPDGTAIALWAEGDDFHAVFETPDGYTVAFDPASKAYFYASVSADGTQLLPTATEVGKGDPRTLGLAQHLRISAEARQQQARVRFEKWDLGMGVTKSWEERKSALHQREALLAAGPIVMAPPGFTTMAQKMGLTLLIDFSDVPASIPQPNIEQFCNGDAYAGYGNNGSVKKYFYDNSNALLVYSNNVTAYIRMVKPKSYYANTSLDCGDQANELIRDAVAIMKAWPNYTSDVLPTFSNLTVDGGNSIVACNVFYAGGDGGRWQYGLWPHSWALYNVGAQELSPGGKKIFKYQVTNIGNTLTLGTFCHENGHMLCGFPDIYDYGYDSTGGAGMFCLMNSGGNGGNPVQICAYLKRAAGWATTVELTDQTSLTCTNVATAGAEGFNRFYRYVKPGTATEYFLFENRQRAGRDARIPGAGIAVWHIDERGNKDNQSLVHNTTHANYEVTLVQADNLWHFENYVNSGDANDLFYAGNSAAAYSGAFSDTTTPDAQWWDGTSSLLETEDFSASGPSMTFKIGLRPPVMVTTGALPDGWVGTPYSCQLTAVRGSLPYTWSLVSGGVPAGLAFGSDGLISGVPTEETNAVFSVAVTGGNGLASTNDFSLTINPAASVPYTETFEHGGAIPGGWLQETLTNSVPWSFRNGGALANPPAAHGGSYNAALAVATTNHAVTRLISKQIVFGPSPRAAQVTFWHYMDQYVNDQDVLKVYCKTSAYGAWTLLHTYATAVNTWTQQTLALPTPAPNGTVYLMFEGYANYGYGIYVDDMQVTDPTPPLAITSSSPLPDALIDKAYTNALAAIGGTAPYTYQLVGGGLPAGMGLSAGGVITGTCHALTNAQFSVRLTDAETNSVTKVLDLAVVLPRADLFTETFEHLGQLPAGWTQEFVAQTTPWICQTGGGDSWGHYPYPLAAHGGTYNAILWANPNSDHKTRFVTPLINLGAAPASIRLIFWHCMNVLVGDQDELRVYYKTAATNAWNLIATYTKDVPVWTQRTLMLPNPTSTYYLAFEGNAKFGSGVCLDDIRISDEALAPIITTTTPLPTGTLNVPYSQTLAAVGGVEPYTWTVVSNALPSGLTLNSSSGVISGTPVGAAVPFRVRVAGADGLASTNLFSLAINLVRSIPFTETFENGGNIPPGWTQEPGYLAPGWSFMRGSASGTPFAAHSGTYNANLFIPSYCATYPYYYVNRLVTPALNLGVGTTNTSLAFWHHMGLWGNDQDLLKVYYKASTNGSWTLLQTFAADTTAWTKRTVALPNPSATYYIAFEGGVRWGYGVSIDDVEVTGNTLYKSYASWQSELLSGYPSGDFDDPDSDGVVNILEYAMGLNPVVRDAAGFPVGGVTNNYLVYAYQESKDALGAGFRFTVEACTSLVENAWSTNGVSEFSRVNTNLVWSVKDRHNVPVTNAPQRFLRLKVYQP